METRNTLVVHGAAVGAAVVIFPSAFGAGPDLEAQMRELPGLAVAVDPFGGPMPYEDMAGVMARVTAFDRARGYEAYREAIAWTREQPGVRSIVALGLCLGGPFALLAAADGLADAAVAWHGSGMQAVLGRAAEIRCPLRLHFGAADPFVPAAVVDEVRRAFAGHDEARITVHEGATHGFSHRGAARAYDPRAERAAMDDLRELLTPGRGRGRFPGGMSW